MDINTRLAPRETLKIHEILAFKNLCATKTPSMSALVSDDELKTIMQQDLVTSQSHIKQLEDLITKSDMYAANPDYSMR